MKRTSDVGRVGLLAIAVGIGVAVSGATAGVSRADGPAAPGAGTSSQTDSGSIRSDAPRRGGRAHRGAADHDGLRPLPEDEPTAVEDPVADLAVPPGSEPAEPETKGSDRDPFASPAAAALSPTQHVRDRVSVATGGVDLAPVATGGVDLAPEVESPGPERITEPASRRVVPVAEPAWLGGFAAPVLTAPPTEASAAAAPSAVAARPLTLTQPVHLSARPTAIRVLSALFGSMPAGPFDSPVNWVMLAAVREQWGVVRARTGVPMAAVATAVNNPPVITSVVLSAPNSSTGAVTGTVSASDPDADKITYKATTSSKGTVSITTAGVFIYTPTATARHAAAKLGASTATTTDTVTVTVTDAKGAVSSRAVSVPILGKNTVPTATKAVGSPNTTTGVVTGTVTGSDADRDLLSYSTSAPAKGTVSITTAGAFTYTPTATARHAAARIGASSADKSDSFTVIVADGYGGSVAIPISVAISPNNSAPAATATIARPDPVSGVAKGAVSATDTDTDILAYTASTPANGAVSVSSDGTFAYTPTAAARTSASTVTGAKTDTFTITVADGYGGSKAVSITATIAPPSVAPGALSTFCGCTLMPANTVFHADVSSLPVLAKSSTWTALIGGNLSAAWGGDPWMGHTGGMPVNTVPATRPGETVIFNRGYSTSGPSIDSSLYAIPDYPIVEGMPSSPAWDRHLLVLQEGSCVSQELYNVANGVELPASDFGDALANSIYANNYGSTWLAEAGVHYNMNSALYPTVGWANASRLPYLPLILRPDDLARGSIDHMLGIAIAKDRGTGYTWPARAGDGTGTNPDGVPMGTVFRLRADFDISTYDPATQVVLRGLQQHGAVVFDSVNAGQDGATLLAMSNGWTGTEYLTVQKQLRTVPMSAFEAVDVLSLAADPISGWATR